jgi:hypothetical protein
MQRFALAQNTSSTMTPIDAAIDILPDAAHAIRQYRVGRHDTERFARNLG